ncbi:MAG: hypothetical protein LBB21_02495 [Holosporaceae bacterium]|nr:hypothetical protein [Holosporaceae bacterium]
MKKFLLCGLAFLSCCSNNCFAMMPLDPLQKPIGATQAQVQKTPCEAGLFYYHGEVGDTPIFLKMGVIELFAAECVKHIEHKKVPEKVPVSVFKTKFYSNKTQIFAVSVEADGSEACSEVPKYIKLEGGKTCLKVPSYVVKTVKLDAAREGLSARDMSLYLSGKQYNRRHIEIIVPTHFATISPIYAKKQWKPRKIGPVASLDGVIAGTLSRYPMYLDTTSEILHPVLYGDYSMLLFMKMAKGISVVDLLKPVIIGVGSDADLSIIFRIIGKRVAEFHSIGAVAGNPFLCDLLHGDLHSSNILLDEESSLVTFIDMAMCKRGERREDIFRFISSILYPSFAKVQKRDCFFDLVRNFIGAYFTSAFPDGGVTFCLDKSFLDSFLRFFDFSTTYNYLEVLEYYNEVLSRLLSMKEFVSDDSELQSQAEIQ